MRAATLKLNGLKDKYSNCFTSKSEVVQGKVSEPGGAQLCEKGCDWLKASKTAFVGPTTAFTSIPVALNCETQSPESIGSRCDYRNLEFPALPSLKQYATPTPT